MKWETVDIPTKKQAALRIMAHVCVMVCVFDIFETVRRSDSLAHMEENGVAAFLISVDRVALFYHAAGDPEEIRQSVSVRTVDVSRLVLFKTLGIVAAIHLFELLVVQVAWRMSLAIIGSVFVGQVLLLLRLLT